VCVPEVLQRFPARRCTRATPRRRSRRVSELGEPIVDATPRTRMRTGTRRCRAHRRRVLRWLELVVGAAVADENRDGVVSSGQRSVTWMPAPLRFGEHPSGGGTGGSVIVRVVHCISSCSARTQSTS
jgi:hypothetical protein